MQIRCKKIRGGGSDTSLDTAPTVQQNENIDDMEKACGVFPMLTEINVLIGSVMYLARAA